MAQFSMRVQVIQRSKGRSVMAAAAYRAGEKLYDERQEMIHDYSRRSGVERTEILFPDNAPAWTHGISREALWQMVDRREPQKNSQTAREVRLMIPRELPVEDRITLVRDYVQRAFVAKGMIADVCWHNKTASDGGEQPHAHVMLTMRPLTETGFGNKSRHEWVPAPSGQTHPDGRPVMVESNPDSWNSAVYYEQECRKGWEDAANAALERAGSDQRIDRRSLLERGLARMPEPALRLAFHLKELHGVLRERFGQWQVAQHYRAVENRTKAAFAKLDEAQASPAEIVRTANRFIDWFDRQIERLGFAPASQNRVQPDHEQNRSPPHSPTPDLER